MIDQENRKERLCMKIIDVVVGFAVIIVVILSIQRNLNIL